LVDLIRILRNEDNYNMKKLLMISVFFIISLLLKGNDQPSLGNIIINHPEGGEEIISVEWCYVPAGDFTWGKKDKIKTINYDYEIMKYEVTNQQYVDFLLDAIADSTIKLSKYSVEVRFKGNKFIDPGLYRIFGNSYMGRVSKKGNTFLIEEGYANHPIEGITKIGKIAYADYYGWRLPTEEEWEKAARGLTGNDYPWGDSLSPKHANYKTEKRPMNFMTTPVGFYNGQNYFGFQTIDSQSTYGCYDMAGNLSEMIAIDGSTASVVLRGGDWASSAYSLTRYCSWQKYVPYEWDPLPPWLIGFRCVRDFDN
jgi:formylglycine-generating enzyme required for sulfatase activity